MLYFEERADPPFFASLRLPKWTSRSLDTELEDSSSEDEDDAESEEILAKREQMERERHEHRNANHPGRSSRYKLTVNPYIGTQHRYQLVEWIRQASNVSVLFRKELGDVLWTRTELSTNGGPSDMWQLVHILTERPAIRKGIKSLVIELDFLHEMPWKEAAAFETWCDCLSRNLRLERLHVWFKIREEDINRFSSGEGPFAPLVGFRKLHVSESFSMAWSINTEGVPHSFNEPYDYEYDEKDEDARIRYIDALRAQWKPILREVLLPDTLRRKELSEQEMYMKFRQQQPTSKDIHDL